MTGYRLCDNCALKYADCKGNKDVEKCHCDYYKKPIVMNVKELAERVAELEIENERLRRITEAPTAEAVHKPDYSYEADMVRRLKIVMSSEAEYREDGEE